MTFTFHSAILVFHILCGTTVLLSGLLLIALPKGTLLHRRIGSTYFWSITGVTGSGLLLGTLIIVLIGLFGYYYAYTGFRYAKRKGAPFSIADKAALLSGLILSLCMIGMAISCFRGAHIPEAVILLVFGTLFITNVIPDLRQHILGRRPKAAIGSKASWIFEHFGRMYISYIMALTAFAAINNVFGITLLNWLLPTVIGTALITLTKRYYKHRLYKNAALLLISGMAVLTSSKAQPRCEERFSFAQSVFGIGIQTTVGGVSAYELGQGQIRGFRMSPQLSPVLYFGGLHFWHRTEFYFSFPVAQLLPGSVDSVSYRFKQSDIFGLKYFPFRLCDGSVRPYIGLAICGADYQQSAGDNSGVNHSKISLPVLAGCSYLSRGRLLELSLKYDWQNAEEYYLSRTTVYKVKTPPLCLSLNYKLVRDGTAGNARDYCSGRADSLKQQLASARKLGSCFIGLGVSYGFFTGKNIDDALGASFLNRPVATGLIIEPGIGYYSEILKLLLNLSYRRSEAILSGYGLTQKFIRNAFSADAARYLFDYNGFVPFAGLSISYDRLHIEQMDDLNPAANRNYQSTGASVGFSFGWDILPTGLEFFTLRTNLRYYPFLCLKDGTFTYNFKQFEFNIIQAVFYPQRLKRLKALK